MCWSRLKVVDTYMSRDYLIASRRSCICLPYGTLRMEYLVGAVIFRQYILCLLYLVVRVGSASPVDEYTQVYSKGIGVLRAATRNVVLRARSGVGRLIIPCCWSTYIAVQSNNSCSDCLLHAVVSSVLCGSIIYVISPTNLVLHQDSTYIYVHVQTFDFILNIEYSTVLACRTPGVDMSYIRMYTWRKTYTLLAYRYPDITHM